MFSILTPTYNRAKVLHRVFDSLRAQTFKEFHWVIVDDGGTDDTEKLISEWQKTGQPFEIKYYKLPENKGKQFALNYGFPLCREPFTIIADSDDTFDPNTLMDMKILWEAIDATTNGNRIATIWTLVKDEDQNLVGEPYPKDFWQVNIYERILDREGPTPGEKWHSWRTSVLQEYKMFYNENSSYIGESATWHRINKDYDFLCVNLIHRTYYRSADGIMHKKKSNLKLSKTRYYTSYNILKLASISEIFTKKYYRQLAFEYSKSSLYYSDPENKLPFSKKMACLWIAFLSIPRRILFKLENNPNSG